MLNKTEPAPLLQWGLVEQRDRLTGEIRAKCALTMCVFHIPHTYQLLH